MESPVLMVSQEMVSEITGKKAALAARIKKACEAGVPVSVLTRATYKLKILGELLLGPVETWSMAGKIKSDGFFSRDSYHQACVAVCRMLKWDGCMKMQFAPPIHFAA